MALDRKSLVEMSQFGGAIARVIFTLLKIPEDRWVEAISDVKPLLDGGLDSYNISGDIESNEQSRNEIESDLVAD